MTTNAHAKSMSASPGPLSGRILGKSCAIHGSALALLLLVPAGPLRHSTTPKVRDVVFHEPPRLEIPAPIPLPPARAAVAGMPGPLKVEQVAPRGVPQPSSPPVSAEPLMSGIPDLPPGPENLPVTPEPPQPKGILAFREQLASLSQDKVTARLGADAKYRVADDTGEAQMPSRSMLTNTLGTSGGIDPNSLNLSVGGGSGGRGGGQGGGGGMQGVPLGRATSSIAGIGGGGGGTGNGGGGGTGRPQARGGPGASRTDEEIQIVFDRYKASFYRLYNRELRNDPTLQGQMVLRLTIEPDGSVSMCVLQSSDMNAPDLASQVVNRVLTINFGAKEGVAALTIVYPIDFLPAA